MMFGINGSSELQESIDLGAKVVKVVKPCRNNEFIYEKVREASDRGFVADGAAGLDFLINRITAELLRTMAVTGCTNILDIDRSTTHYPSFVERAAPRYRNPWENSLHDLKRRTGLS